MKILTLDIETVPNVVTAWGMYNQNLGIHQIRQPGRVISFAAKWHGEKPVLFLSEYHHSHERMIEKAWALLDEADIVVHYNGNKFDIPWLKTEFTRLGMPMPSPWRDVDLYQVAKKHFRFPSNKLEYVTRELGLSGKLRNGGYEMWDIIMFSEDEVLVRRMWNLMRRYNKQDVVTTEELFDHWRSYIKLPNPALYDKEWPPEECHCGGTWVKRGFAYTSVSVYQRYRCNGCGSWNKGGKRVLGVDLRSAL